MQRTHIEMLCDLPHTKTGTVARGASSADTEIEVEAVSHHDLVVDGQTYAWDSCEAHDEFLVKQLAPFTVFPVRIPRKGPHRVDARGSGTGRAQAHTPKENGVVRAWAKSNGYEIGDRGRIPFEVWEAYSAAAA